MNLQSVFLKTLTLTLGVISLAYAGENITYPIKIPAPRDATINPSKMLDVTESEFNRNVMPKIMGLQFYSHTLGKWVAVPYREMLDNCFARRTAVDAYLWFGEPLKADLEVKGELKRYLLPAFKKLPFKDYAWVETARVEVAGLLQTKTGIQWNNHEAVVVNTDHGVRVVDPSFANRLLSLEEWYKAFAPEGKCIQSTSAELREINSAIVMHQQFKKPWPKGVPQCGYVFKQRLNTDDMISLTAYFFGTPEEKFLSAKFHKYFEEDLIGN